MEEAESFLERLRGKRVQGDVEDMVFWTETKSGKFSIKSLYYALELDNGQPFSFSFKLHLERVGAAQD